MFQQAVKRLFLILFPITLFLIALSLSHFRPPVKTNSKLKEEPVKDCPFYFGLSFFSGKRDFQKNKLITHTLNEQNFIKKIQALKPYFQAENISYEKIFFVFPISLTKEEEWIVSQKTNFILPTGERKEISQLSHSEISRLHKQWDKDYRVLTLNFIFSYLPKNSNFLFLLIGSDRNKIIKNLEEIQNKTKGMLYLSSSNEKLLKELLLSKTNSSSGQTNIKILHSFKSLIRLGMLSLFPQSFKPLLGDGVIAPEALTPSTEMLNFLRQKKKLLFLEKEPPYTLEDRQKIKNSQALISSQAQLAISSIKGKKTCLIKN